MKNSLFVLLIFVTNQISAQNTLDDELRNALLNYKIAENSWAINDSLHLLHFNEKLERALQQNEDLSKFTRFNATLDSLDMVMNHINSEDKSLVAYHLSNGMDHWNYVLKNRQIIVNEYKSHEYFTEIHVLNDKEFLLREQRDDLVFSCNHAYVFRKKGNEYHKKKAFKNGEKLTICNFTHLEESIAIPPPSENGTLPVMTGTHYFEPARKISFNATDKTLEYGICYNYFTQKTHIGKAKYKNGKFKIKDCDERLFYD